MLNLGSVCCAAFVCCISAGWLCVLHQTAVRCAEWCAEWCALQDSAHEGREGGSGAGFSPHDGGVRAVQIFHFGLKPLHVFLPSEDHTTRHGTAQHLRQGVCVCVGVYARVGGLSLWSLLKSPLEPSGVVSEWNHPVHVCVGVC
jgi:hypothetical protein